jgi:hypothetical protein
MAYPPTVPPNNRANSTASFDNHPGDHNDIADALNDIVSELGSGPKGATAADLTARLASFLDASDDVDVIAANAVNSAQIAAGAIDLAHMSPNSVDSDQYVDGSIDAAHIANDQINSQHYAAGSIDNEHMAANSVDSDQYVNGSIDTVHIGDDQVTLAKIQDTAWTTPTLGSGWSNHSAARRDARCRKLLNSIVFLEANVKKTAAISIGDTVMTLPSGYWPADQISVPIAISEEAATDPETYGTPRLLISTDGVCTIYGIINPTDSGGIADLSLSCVFSTDT